MAPPENAALEWLDVAGNHHEIGWVLGTKGRQAVEQHLLGTELWRKVTDQGHDNLVATLSSATRDRFPGIWDEIQGLAEGLRLPVRQVMAWNCRGEILSSTPDGCTTVQQPGPVKTVSHNEDGLPFFKHACFIVNAEPVSATGFQSFCYPGSLPGHAFAFNNTGLVQTVNNIRLRYSLPAVPRMVLTRAILCASTLDEALELLASNPDSGGFHVTLAHKDDSRLLSVEFGGGNCSVKEVLTPAVHTNHALHLDAPGQIITRSSADRQARGDELLENNNVDALAILYDKSGPQLPIFRSDPQDPDSENTLATCKVCISGSGVSWRIFEPGQTQPAYQKN